MISIRKHIDTYKDSLAEFSLSGWRASLQAMAQSADRAVPGLGQELSEKLSEAQRLLEDPVTPELLSRTKATVETELAGWAERAWQHHTNSVQEIREIIAVVAQASDSVARRDERYAQQIGDLNGRLQDLVQMDSLPLIRQSILESTRALKACVEKMAAEGQESLRKLTGEVAEYRARLEASERIASTDSLTQLANRRAFEKNLAFRMAAKQVFSLIMMDLDGFKSVNDQHGHLAGDDLLRQFAVELRTHFRPTDLLSRWGGDEFVAIVGLPQGQAEARVEQICKWVLGEYKIKTSEAAAGGKIAKVTVQASFGVVEWDGAESGPQLLARADACLYRLKPGREKLLKDWRASTDKTR